MTQAPTPSGTPVDLDLCGRGATRRGFLAGSVAAAGAGVLAACGAGGSPGKAQGATAPSGGSQTLVALADVPVGGAVSVTTPAGDPIVVAQPTTGAVVAFSAICTHQGCVVEPDGAELRCPCHGSVFEAFTGARVSGPARRPLDAVAVDVQDGQVVPA